MNRRKYIYLAAIIPFFLLTLMYELIPVAMTVIRSFQVDTGVGLDNYAAVFAGQYYLKSITNSLVISLGSSAVGIIIAFLGSYAAFSSPEKTRRLFSTVLNIAANFAGVPLAFSYIILFGSSGIMVALGSIFGIQWLADYNLYSSGGLSLIYIYFQIPVATLVLMPAFESIKTEWLESAQLLKASKLRFWTSVGLPVIFPSIAGTFCFLFANSMSAYATAYALVGSNYSLLTVQIASMFTGDVFPKYGLGSALSVIMIVLISIAVYFNSKLISGRGAGYEKA